MFNFITNASHKKPEKAKPIPKIRILDTRMQRGHGYLLIHGFFVNESDHDINNVLAVAECFSSSGRLIRKSDMMVDDMTIKPKQVSSFSIATADKPYIEDVKISFKYLLGQEIEVAGMNS